MSEIVAFLQNVWVKDPDWFKGVLERDPSLRPRLLRRLLFHGGLTGRRLKEAFGDLCDDIYWEEASTEIGGHSASSFPADLEHMKRVLDEQQPVLVLAFGKVAADALDKIWPEQQTVIFPHPAARHLNAREWLNWKEQLIAALHYEADNSRGNAAAS